MKVACVQADVVYNCPDQNAERAVAELRSLAAQGVDLVVFPEAFLTGYTAESHEQTLDLAIPNDHPAVTSIGQVARDLGVVAVVGFVENAGSHRAANTALIALPDRDAFYRKVHLPFMGIDRYVIPGEELAVFDTPFGKLGVAICFDLRIPETFRVLALKGAEIVALPTNWPEGAVFGANFIAPVRAAENRIFVATCDRVGDENGFHFIGQSGIFAPTGQAVARAGDSEEVLVADIDLAEARTKQNVMIPGAYETNVFTSRRPELYSALVEK